MRSQFPFLRLYHCSDFRAAHSHQHGQLSVPTIELLSPAEGMPVEFDGLAEYFEPLPNAHFEWDGSVVWRSSDECLRWQVDLQIYDLGEEIQYIEWKGSAPPEDWCGFVEILHLSRRNSESFKLVAHWIDVNIWLDHVGIQQLMEQSIESKEHTC